MIMMKMKRGIVSLFVSVAALATLAIAQTAQVSSSSAKTGPDPLKTATKPLTPKSAMPPQHKSTAVVPATATSSQKSSAELNRLERQNVKDTSSKSGGTASAKSPSVKSNEAAGGNSGIDFKYHKPTGGMQAATPNANSKNSSTPRVNKKN